MESLLGEQQLATASLLAKEIDMDLEECLEALKRVAVKVTPAMRGKTATLQTLLEANPSLERLFNRQHHRRRGRWHGHCRCAPVYGMD